MTLNKTLQKIIQRAELQEKDFPDLLGLRYEAALNANKKVLPIIKGLCEEVQRLRTALEFYGDRYSWYSDIGKKDFYMIATQDVEQLATDDIDVVGGKTARQALSTSALEKLGGGE